MTTEQLKIANQKYRGQQSHSKSRGIEFNLTFEEWLDIWLDSGYWHLRGKGKGKYVMSRIGDTGPYSLENVFIQSNSDNVIQAQRGRRNSLESNLKRSLTQSGRKQTPEWIAKKAESKRKHHKELVGG